MVYDPDSPESGVKLGVVSVAQSPQKEGERGKAPIVIKLLKPLFPLISCPDSHETTTLSSLSPTEQCCIPGKPPAMGVHWAKWFWKQITPTTVTIDLDSAVLIRYGN